MAALHALQVEGNLLCFVTDVDHLDNDGVGGFLIDSRGEESVLVVVACYGFLVHGEGEYVVTLVVSVKALHVP